MSIKDKINCSKTAEECRRDLEEYTCWLLNEYQYTRHLHYLLHGWMWSHALGDPEVCSVVDSMLLHHIESAEPPKPAALPPKHHDRFKTFQENWKRVEAMVVRVEADKTVQDAAYEVAGGDDKKMSHLIDLYYKLGLRVTRGRVPAKSKKRR